MKTITSKKKQKRDSANWRLVILPYEEGTSERIARVMRKHQIPVAMRLVKTLKSLLVHPKDKQEKEEITDCVYKIPCASCEKSYIGETGRRFGTTLKEHKTEVESITSKPFTRNLSEQNKSALTDHASHDNHVINWPASTILDRESDKSTRWIKEAVHIRKEGRQSLNRDEGSYSATRTTDFLPRRITIVARTGRGIEQTSSDEGV